MRCVFGSGIGRDRKTREIPALLLGELHQFVFEGMGQCKLGDLPIRADQMPVLCDPFQGQLKDVATMPQIAALQDACLLKLGQHLVHRCQTERLLPLEQLPVNLVRSQVTDWAGFEHIEDLQTGRRASQHKK